MKSESRKHLHKAFEEIPIGTVFQMINQIVGGALYTSAKLKKIGNQHYNSVDLSNGNLVRIKPDTIVEVIP